MAPVFTRTILTLRNRHLFLLDFCCLLFTPAVALALRIDNWMYVRAVFSELIFYTAYALLIRMAVYSAAGFYRRYWRYTSVDDLMLLARGSLVATAVILFLFILLRLPVLGLCGHEPSPCALPRVLPLIDSALAFGTVVALRLSVRMAAMWRRHRAMPAHAMQRVLVMGAGESGAMIVGEMHTHPSLGLEPVGFVDDDPDKQGMHIHGVPVLGGRRDLFRLIDERHAVQVIIAMPTAPGKIVREVLATCEVAGVPARTVPSLNALLDGKVSVNQLRPVQIEDLLRREPVCVDAAAVQQLLAGKRVLVTGGGGSIGSELCRQVLRARPAELIILGHGENSIFEIVQELVAAQHALAPAQRVVITPLIADIRFGERIRQLFLAARPDIVFHAAAHKHVPLMEENPAEAVTNNVLGTRNVVAAATAAGVAHFVLISTDKAVNPVSLMGASKRVAELITRRAAYQSGRAFVAVRFGNVLGSRGSVVLTFKRQIATGGPVTVTDPEMKRFFMTIPEAVQLVLQAATLGVGGEVFMLDMGEPVKIVDLARDLIVLSGLREGQDIDITFTGMRPGEKMFEELFIPGEHYGATCHAKLFTTGNGHRPVPADLEAGIEALARAAAADNREEIVRELRRLVPEFQAPPCAAPAVAAPAIGEQTVAARV